MNEMPPHVDAVVVAQDGDNYRLVVAFMGGLGAPITPISVDVARPGHGDNVRGSWPPLPAVGTHGRISFSRRDNRNGRWEGSHSAALTDSSSHSASHPNLNYTLHFDGGFDWRGQDGTDASVFADGSYILVGNTVPEPTRHVLDSSQNRIAVPFPAVQRNPTPPGPLPITISQAAGAVVVMQATGEIDVTAAAGQAVKVVANGGTFEISGSGAVTMISADGTEISLPNDGNVHITGGLLVSGQVIAGNGGADQVGLQTHRHGTGTPAAAGTATPTPGT